MADVGAAMQRAIDKTDQMQARASAVEELPPAWWAMWRGLRTARRAGMGGNGEPDCLRVDTLALGLRTATP